MALRHRQDRHKLCVVAQYLTLFHIDQLQNIPFAFILSVKRHSKWCSKLMRKRDHTSTCPCWDLSTHHDSFFYICRFFIVHTIVSRFSKRPGFLNSIQILYERWWVSHTFLFYPTKLRYSIIFLRKILGIHDASYFVIL